MGGRDLETSKFRGSGGILAGASQSCAENGRRYGREDQVGAAFLRLR